MRKHLFVLLMLAIRSQAQIIAPDTVCVGAPVIFSTPQQAVTYDWDFNAVSVDATISSFSTLYNGSSTFSTVASSAVAFDAGHYYIFSFDYFAQNVYRLDFGSNIHSTPTVTNLGSFGLTAGDGEGIDIVKDEATGQWYGVTSNYSQLMVLSFGTSLASTPTASINTFSDIVWGHLLKIKEYMGNWYVFLCNRNGTMTRFDFGSSLSGTPVQNIIPNVGGCYTPVDFTLYEESGSWYMLISDLASNNITLYEFGTDLLNLAPTGVNLGNPGGFLSYPRNINLLHDCNDSLICYIGNEGGHFTKLNFGSSITNTPTATDLGVTSLERGASIPFSYNDSFYFILTDPVLNKLWIYNPFYFSTPTDIVYYDSVHMHTFTTPGTYHISLFCDLGSQAGQEVYCRDIVVLPGTGTTSSHDTTVCSSTALTLTADSASNYIWNTGDTTSSISVDSSGTYWVMGTTNSTLGTCSYIIDTSVVSFITGSAIYIHDTTICGADTITLVPTVSASGYTWSTGATTPTITVSTNGTYWVSDTAGVCLAGDTFHVHFAIRPSVDLGDDTSVCGSAPIVLRSSVLYPATSSYLWSTGATSVSIVPSSSGTYWLTVTEGVCTGADTTSVDIIPNPVITLHNTFFCAGDSVLLTSVQPAGSVFMWSTGSISDSITVSDSGIYWLGVTDSGCTTYDTIHISEYPIPSVNLGPDTFICAGKSMLLQSSYTYAAATYAWSTGASEDTFSAVSAGTYWLDVTQHGCTGSDTVNIWVIANPVVSLPDTSFCIGDSILLSTAQPEGSSYLWSTGNTSGTTYISDSGTYWLSVSYSGCTTTDTFSVAAFAVPVVNLGHDTTFCSGSSIELNSLYSYTNVSYLWNTGANDSEISVATGGAYWLQVDQNNCIGSDSVTITVRSTPAVDLGPDTSICYGTTITIGSPEPEGSTYLWNTGSSDSSIVVSDSGTYSVYVSDSGCSASATVFIGEQFLPVVDLGPDTFLCAGQDYVLTTHTNGIEYLWSDDSHSTSINVAKGGTYWVIISNQCGTVRDSVTITEDLCDIWFPSAFTPNGDNLNDIARVVGTLKDFTGFSLSIYNRFGQRVFYTEDINSGWDGTFNGEKQDIGTFYYMIYYTLQGRQHMMKGDLTLIR